MQYLKQKKLGIQQFYSYKQLAKTMGVGVSNSAKCLVFLQIFPFLWVQGKALAETHWLSYIVCIGVSSLPSRKAPPLQFPLSIGFFVTRIRLKFFIFNPVPTKFLVTISLQTFFVIKYFRFYFLLCKIFTPSPQWRKSPPLSLQPPSKNWDPVKPTLFENLVGGSNSQKGAHFKISCQTLILCYILNRTFFFVSFQLIVQYRYLVGVFIYIHLNPFSCIL